jgi:hypothetical protein
MAVTYACDQCGHEAESLTGWYLTAVQLLYEDPIKPSPPGGRTLDYQYPDLVFHTAVCRDAWLIKIGLTPPVLTDPVIAARQQKESVDESR